MGIQISGAISRPEITFNRVFLRRLSIEQAEISDDMPPPRYKVFIEYRLYGVSDGVRHYHGDIREIEHEDFVGLAISQAQVGDITLLTALPTIEAAIAKLVEGDLSTTAQVV